MLGFNQFYENIFGIAEYANEDFSGTVTESVQSTDTCIYNQREKIKKNVSLQIAFDFHAEKKARTK